MWEYKITNQTIKQDSRYADYEFDVLYNGKFISKNNVSSMEILKIDEIFERLTKDLEVPDVD